MFDNISTTNFQKMCHCNIKRLLFNSILLTFIRCKGILFLLLYWILRDLLVYFIFYNVINCELKTYLKDRTSTLGSFLTRETSCNSLPLKWLHNCLHNGYIVTIKSLEKLNTKVYILSSVIVSSSCLMVWVQQKQKIQSLRSMGFCATLLWLSASGRVMKPQAQSIQWSLPINS